jgi:hypothetical protein
VEEPNSAPRGLSDAVSEATSHVQARAHVGEAATRPHDRSRGRLLAFAVTMLGGVLALDAYVLTRAPAPLPPTEEAEDLRRFVGMAVELIEDFRAETGRLPSRGDLGDLLDPELFYRVADGSYVVGLEGEGVSVEYDSGTPLDAWIDSGGDTK